MLTDFAIVWRLWILAHDQLYIRGVREKSNVLETWFVPLSIEGSDFVAMVHVVGDDIPLIMPLPACTLFGMVWQVT